MSRSRFKTASGAPAAPVARHATASIELVRLWPILSICLLVISTSAFSFVDRGQGGVTDEDSCITITLPETGEDVHATWAEFFVAYPFDDPAMEARIRTANPDRPPVVVKIPLSDNADCS